ncbi:MAG: hypothetical protein JNM67_09890, partial [Bacteroidetes bacterium]|nr:hypothetical protein [Bacteroidota bacterium]
DLENFEYFRHNYVHNAGKIDRNYKENTKNEALVIGDKIDTTPEIMARYCNSSFKAINQLFRFAEKLTKK